MKLVQVLETLPKFTRWCFELPLRVGGSSKVAPFQVNKKVNGVSKVEKFTNAYQWQLYYLIWSGFNALTIYHCYAGYKYFKVNGMNSSTAIYTIFVMIYMTAVILSLSLAFYSIEAIALLNSSSGSECRGLFAEIKWERDFFLQFLAAQLLPFSILVQIGSCLVLPWLYPEAPWMLVSHLQWLLRYFPWIFRILAVILIEFINIALPQLLCMTSVSVFMIAFTVMKIALRRLKLVSKGSFDQAVQACRQLQIYSQVCNGWWRPLFVPGTAFISFMYILFPSYFTLTKYNSDLPIYIYAIYPMFFVVTLVATLIVYAEMAYIYILSSHIVKDLCAKNSTSFPEHADFRLSTRRSNNVKAKAYHITTIVALTKRHVLSPIRPVRIEASTFGHYIKITAAVKIVNEAFTYLLLLLTLRELKQSG